MPSPVNRLTDPNTDPIDVLSVVSHTFFFKKKKKKKGNE
jgi:hypothetical protein